MKGRLLSMAFLLGVLSTGLTWLSVQPILLRLMGGVRRFAPPGSSALEAAGQLRRLLPLMLTLDVLLLTLGAFVLLHFTLGRPLRRMEEMVERLGRLELDQPLARSGGPLLSRVQSALGRMAAALQEERALTRAQLTALHAANERLAVAQTELIASERLATAGRLAAGVAHEVGNPLSGVLGYVSLTRSRLQGQPEPLSYLDHIEAEVQRINGIVRGLLDLGRGGELRLAPMELAPLVGNCVAMVRAGPEFRGVSLQLELQPTVARVDPAALTQVLINLLLNAAQATAGSGHVWVRLAPGEDGSLLDVEDDGPGIPEDVVPHLFEPFFTTKASGTGLGLAISLRLITAMGGRLTAGPRPGGGARLRIRLAAPGGHPHG